jgi:pilus assembly protein FimV
MQFDLGGLSLDLGDPAEKTVIIPPAPLEDPLATKLSLAEEFSTIGDDDGARALIEEVMLEATGDMKARAQLALAKLS